MHRQIVLDTETTGMPVEAGHKVIEIGCVEIIDRHLTDNNFHIYINPERTVDQQAFKVHGLSDEFLADKPRFADIAQSLCDFIGDADIIAHNAEFDMGFLHTEMSQCHHADALSENQIIDSLAIARSQYTGMQNSLDALCRRFAIDISKRTYHGALLDASLLAKVYLLMTGGQESMQMEEIGRAHAATNWTEQTFATLYASEDECQAHQRICESIGVAGYVHPEQQVRSQS